MCEMMTTFLTLVGLYFLFVSLNYFVLRMELSFEDMSEDEFKESIFIMWFPVVNVVGLLVQTVSLIIIINNVQKQKRTKENRASFHERLFSVQKVNGKYQKKKAGR